MCGICGFVGPADRSLLERMTGLLRHRGPDDDGFHQTPRVSLGCRRLSIIDVAGGHMPIYNEDHTRCVIQNGEIFNYKELRAVLQAQGHQFRTASDTEVIVHAHEEYGDEFCREFNGDFSIAVWDEPTQTLTLARDRFGVHVIYYTQVGEQFVFASELKSLLCYPGVSRELDPVAVDEYLTLRYVSGGRTLFRQIQKLPPGHILNFREGRMEIRRYWQLPELADQPARLEDAAEELLALLRDSVRLRMRSDVPVGAYLSGGLDSSAIVGLMTQFVGEPIQTFCIGFGTEIDELAEAGAFAQQFGTDHHEIMVGPRDFELLPKIVWHLDEPIGDAIVIPTYRLAQEAGRHVKVVMSGEGADEVWGGYIHHLAIATAAGLPQPVARGLAELVRMLPARLVNAFFPYPAALGERGKQALAEFLAARDPQARYLAVASCFRTEDKGAMYTGPLTLTLSPRAGRGDTNGSPFSPLGEKVRLRGSGALDATMRFDMANWLPDYTLLKQDKLGFAGSLEIRVPYLDYRIAELAFRLPEQFKICGQTTKRLLREAAARIIPPPRARAKKKAFYIPVEKVFGRPFDDFVRDVLGSPRCRQRGWIRPEYLEQRLATVRTGELLNNKQIVALTIFELWCRAFVDGDSGLVGRDQ